MSNLAWRALQSQNEVIVDVRVSCIWLIIVCVESSFIMSMTLKTTKNMCHSAVYTYVSGQWPT